MSVSSWFRISVTLVVALDWGLSNESRSGGAVSTTGAVTWLFFATGTDDLATGRLISVAAGSLLPALLFLWLTRIAGLAVGLVAAVFAVFWPQGLIEAQLLRFYAVHVLCFFVGAAAFYNAFTTSGPKRWAWAALAAGTWALALLLQITSVIGIGAALAWACAALLWDKVPGWRGRTLWLTAAAGLAAVALAAAAYTGLLDRVWAFYRWTPDHSMALRDYPGFYQANLRKYHGVLWYATPVLAMVALWIRPRLASYCLILFAALFLTLSFGGMKAFRYFSYAMPFLLTFWALALVGGAVWFGAALTRGREALRPAFTGLIAVLVVAVILTTTSILPRSLTLARGEGVSPRGDWRRATEVVGDWLDAPFIATTRELHMLTYVGPYDLLISPGRVTELRPPQEFGVDRRTGRPIVGSTGSLTALFACKRQGLLVTSPQWWSRQGWGPRMQALIGTAGLQFETRAEGAVMAVRWFDPENRPALCDGVPGAL